MDRFKEVEKGEDAKQEDSSKGSVPKPFMGVKARRFASFRTATKGNYLDVPSNSFLSDLISKRGDQNLLFADKIMQIPGSGKMKSRVMMITDRAIYIADTDNDALKRRIPLASIDRICLSKLSDNFFAFVIPSEYDCLMACTRKNEIVSVLVEATKSKPAYEIGIVFSNRFEYRSDASTVKIVMFEETEGGVKTRILSKTNQ